LGHNGATIRLEIGVSRTHRRALQSAHRPIPQPVSATALVDTGADVSCIEATVLRKIALQRRRAFLLVNSPGIGGMQYQPGYFAGITVLHPSGRTADNLVIPDLLVAELNLQLHGIQFLFGRDALAYCRLQYDGLAGTFALEY
jgi:hypothetical protein